MGSCQSCQLYMHCVDTYPQKVITNRHKFSSCRNMQHMQQNFCGAYQTLSACSAVKQLVRSCVKRNLHTNFGRCRLLSINFFKSFLKCIKGNRCRFTGPCQRYTRKARVRFLCVAMMVGENICYPMAIVAGDL